MWKLIKRLWDDECGFVVTSELILIATIVSLALVVGLREVSQAVTSELVDVANACHHLNQGRRYHGLGWSDDWSGHSEVIGIPASDEDW